MERVGPQVSLCPPGQNSGISNTDLNILPQTTRPYRPTLPTATPPSYVAVKMSDALPRLEKLKKTCNNVPAALAATAAETGVNVDAIWMADGRTTSSSPTPQGNDVLSQEEDTSLVALAQMFSTNNVPPPSLQPRDVTRKCCRNGVTKVYEPGNPD